MATTAASNVQGAFAVPSNNTGANPHDPTATQYSVDLSQNSSFLIDLTLKQITGYVNKPQGIFIDNSQVAVSTTITVQGTNQIIVVAPFSQQMTTIFAQDNTKIVLFNANGSGFINIWLTNFPLTNSAWTTANPIINVGGQLISSSTEGQRPTYQGTTTTVFNPASSPNVLCIGYIQGSATRIVRIKRVSLTIVGTATQLPPGTVISLVKSSSVSLSAPASWGNMPFVKFDSVNDPAPTTVPVGILPPLTSGGTGIMVGPIAIDSLFVSQTNSSYEYVFATRNDKALLLNGTSEFLGAQFNFLRVTPADGSFVSLTFEWEEI